MIIITIQKWFHHISLFVLLKSIHFWNCVFHFMKTRSFCWCQLGLAWFGSFFLRMGIKLKITSEIFTPLAGGSKIRKKSSDVFLRAVPLDEWFGKIPNSDWFSTHQQSHYREVPRWEIFKEQELRFGLDLDRLAVLKKKVWFDYEQHLRVFFFMFSRAKKMLNF